DQRLASWRVCFASDSTEPCIETDALIRHEDFVYSHNNVYLHDIALIHLSKKVSNIQPVCLSYSEATVSSGDLCYWTGWAAAGGMNADQTFQVPIPIIPHETCSLSGFWQNQLTATMVCAGFESPEKVKSSCKSGAEGTLICQSASNSAWEVQGITSFGPNNCLVERKPQVFTKVSAYREWIEDKIKKYNYEKDIA
ncbi:serine-type endopeptidase activity, partial [Pristimantis euphronides]